MYSIIFCRNASNITVDCGSQLYNYTVVAKNEIIYYLHEDDHPLLRRINRFNSNFDIFIFSIIFHVSTRNIFSLYIDFGRTISQDINPGSFILDIELNIFPINIYKKNPPSSTTTCINYIPIIDKLAQKINYINEKNSLLKIYFSEGNLTSTFILSIGPHLIQAKIDNSEDNIFLNEIGTAIPHVVKMEAPGRNVIDRSLRWKEVTKIINKQINIVKTNKFFTQFSVVYGGNFIIAILVFTFILGLFVWIYVLYIKRVKTIIEKEQNKSRDNFIGLVDKY